MTLTENIKSAIDSHSAPKGLTLNEDGTVTINKDDYNSLMNFAHDHEHDSSTPEGFEPIDRIDTSDLPSELAELLKNAPLGAAAKIVKVQGKRDERYAPPPVDRQIELNNRQLALQSAIHYAMHQRSEVDAKEPDVVGIASDFLNFLQGDSTAALDQIFDQG